MERARCYRVVWAQKMTLETVKRKRKKETELNRKKRVPCCLDRIAPPPQALVG
jgi:hypothetical protein